VKPPAPQTTPSWIDWDTAGNGGVVHSLPKAQSFVTPLTLPAPPPRRGRVGGLPRGILLGAMTPEQQSEVRRLRWEWKVLSYLSALSRRELHDQPSDRIVRICRKRDKRAARRAASAYLGFLKRYVESKGGSWR